MADVFGHPMLLEESRRTAKHEVAELILDGFAHGGAHGSPGITADTLIRKLVPLQTLQAPDDEIDPADYNESDDVAEADNNDLLESTTLTLISIRRRLLLWRTTSLWTIYNRGEVPR